MTLFRTQVTASTDVAAEVYRCAIHARAVQLFGTSLQGIDLEVLGVSDPCVQGRQLRVGSGGATVNALLVAAEHLTARMGEATVSSDALRGAHVVVVHAGGEEQHVPPFFPFAKVPSAS